MNTIQFADSHASKVSTAVTFAVSAWLLVAGGVALTTDPADSPEAVRAAAEQTRVVYAAPAVAINPEARLVIVVEGHRV